MNNIKEIVSKNLVNLRKQNNLTQVELSEKINYSDKAISRWEKGEVLPGLDILELLSYVYNVPISYFLEEHFDTESKKADAKAKNIYTATIIFMVMVVWTVAVVAFLAAKNYANKTNWTIFTWAIPTTALVIRLCFRKFLKNKHYILTASICLWTFLAAIYLQWYYLNLWTIFLLGIPFQFVIVFMYLINKIKTPTTKKLKLNTKQVKNKTTKTHKE